MFSRTIPNYPELSHMKPLDRERLRRLVEESKSWPPWLHAALGSLAPSKVTYKLNPPPRYDVEYHEAIERLDQNQGATEMNDFWAGFNPETERAYQGPDGPVRVKVAPAVVLLRTIEPTDSEMDRGCPFETRIARAKELAANGNVVDVQVDVWGWGAANTYRLRRMYGASSVADVSGTVRILTPPAAPTRVE